jgi:hypothetical protein
MVIRRAADEFGPAIGHFQEAGSAEGGDKLTACAL